MNWDQADPDRFRRISGIFPGRTAKDQGRGRVLSTPISMVSKIFMGPEESMQIQSNLASTIAMAFDECPSSVADRDYVENSVERTTRWLAAVQGRDGTG